MIGSFIVFNAGYRFDFRNIQIMPEVDASLLTVAQGFPVVKSGVEGPETIQMRLSSVAPKGTRRITRWNEASPLLLNHLHPRHPFLG